MSIKLTLVAGGQLFLNELESKFKHVNQKAYFSAQKGPKGMKFQIMKG